MKHFVVKYTTQTGIGEVAMKTGPVGNRQPGVKQVLGKVEHSGKIESWRVMSDGGIRTISTSASSTSAMEEAVVIYQDALRRLANR
jgi:hypothetical protein